MLDARIQSYGTANWAPAEFPQNSPLFGPSDDYVGPLVPEPDLACRFGNVLIDLCVIFFSGAIGPRSSFKASRFAAHPTPI